MSALFFLSFLGNNEIVSAEFDVTKKTQLVCGIC